jgi:hypothetical protein
MSLFFYLGTDNLMLGRGMFSYKSEFFFTRNKILIFYYGTKIKFYTDILCLGGVFAKNTSRETKHFPSRMAREI